MRWSMKKNNVRVNRPYVLHLGSDVTEEMVRKNPWLVKFGYPVSEKSSYGFLRNKIKNSWALAEGESVALKEKDDKMLAEIMARSEKE